MALAKVFRIEMNGGRDVEKDIAAIKKAITAMGQAIKQAKAELKSMLSSNADPAAVNALNKRIAELEGRLKSLSAQRKVAETDAKRQAEVEKILADTRKKEAEALKALELAEKARVQAQIAQEKELDRQIALEQKEQRELEKKKKILDALPGSYNAVKAALAQLRPFIQSGGAGGTISFGGQQLNFDQAIAEYKRLSAAEQDFRRQFVKDGTLVGEYASGIVDAFKRLNIDDIIKGQVNGAKQQLGELEKKTNDLVVAYRQAQQAGSADLNKLEKEIHDNVVETEKLKKAVSQAEVQLRGMGGVGDQITGAINRNFKDLKNNIAQFALGYVGFQAIFSGLQTGIDNAKQFSDQTTELELQLNKTAGGADNLVESLKGLNTRTKLTTLEEISTIALKAGVTEQNLLGVTKAIDTMKTAFGKDYGDIETGTETLVKLINIFFEDGQVTEDRILKIGNSIRTLANETVASVPFINDFAGRMAGLRQVANVTLPQIIGLGAGFEEFKQSAEVASTVLVKVIPQMARDVDKFAEIAGKPREEFRKLIDENPIEALLQVAEGMKKGNGDITAFAELLKDAGIEAGRTTSIIATLGGKADIFRQRMALAGSSIQDTAAITDAYNRKNNNLAGTMDKIAKKFADAAAGKAFQTTLLAIGTAITFLLNNIPAILVLGGLLVANWAAQNAQLILLNGRLIAYNLAIGAMRVAQVAGAIVMGGYNIALALYTRLIGGATAATQLFGNAMRLLPIGIILTLVGVLIASFRAFGSVLKGTTAELERHARQQQLVAEIEARAKQDIADQVSNLTMLTKVARDNSISLETRKKALADLIAINPDYLKGLTLENIATSQGTKIIDDYIDALRRKAAFQAAQSIRDEKLRKETELGLLQENLERRIATGNAGDLEDLTDEEKNYISDARKNFAFTASVSDLFTGESAAKEALDAIKAARGKITVELDDIDAVIKEKYTQMAETAKDGNKSVDNTTTDLSKLTLDELYARLKTVNEEIKQVGLIRNKTKEVIDKLKNLRKERNEIIRLIKEQRGNIGNSDRASRLTGQQKDAFKDIEAERDRLLAEQRRSFLNLEIDEKTYLQNTLKINTEAIDKKLALIKGKNAEERKIIAELNLEKIDLQKQTNQKLFELENDRLEASLRNEELAAQRVRDTTLLNPDLTNTQRLQVDQDYQERLLKARIVFNQQQIELEKKYGIASIENETKRKEAIEKINHELNELLKKGPDARQKDIQDAGERQLNEFRTSIAQRTIAILESNKSQIKKARELQELENQATKDQLANDAATAKAALDQAKKDRDAKLISEKEYLDKLEDYKTKEAALYKATTNEQVSATQRFINALKSLKDSFAEAVFGIKQYTRDAEGDAQKMADAISFTANTIKDTIAQATQNYFENRNRQVEAEKQQHMEALDREKERALATANSQAERETIERQFEARRKKEEQKAAEQKKKIALQQLTVDFAVALIKTFAQFGFPLGLIPAAALTGMYLVQRAQVQKTQFEYGGALKKKKQYGLGGKAGEVPVDGGYFGGKSHAQGGTDFSFNGQQYNAEVDEMNIIRTKNAPKNKRFTISGNHAQIASALNTLGGGVSFQPGAQVSQFANGGQLGGKLRAPTFTASGFTGSGNVAAQNDRLDRLEKMTEDVLTAVYATDAKPVQLNPNLVTEAQERTKKDVSLATI